MADKDTKSNMADLGMLPEWDLTEFYTGFDDPQIGADISALSQDILKFKADYHGRMDQLADDSVQFGQSVAQFEGLIDRAGRISSYADLIYNQDSGSERRQKFYGDINDQLTKLQGHILFFVLEINKIDTDRFSAMLDNAQEGSQIMRYRPWLRDIRLDRDYELDERSEKLFLEKSSTSSEAWNRLFDETLARMRFVVDGRKQALETTLDYLVSPDRKMRRKAASAVAKGLASELPVFSLITNTLAKDKEISDRWRGFNDIADSRHLDNRVDGAVVDALVNAVVDAYPRLSHRYYKLKAKWLGLSRLRHYDRNAPLPGAITEKIPFSKARDTVIDAYDAFSPEMAKIADRFFAENRIDAAARAGKSPGAFAHPTVPSARPYILLNYLGRNRDVMTLAHELGHGVHQTLAGDLGVLMASTPLTLAETASVFGEMLTFRSLLAQTKDPEQNRIMRAEKVEDMLNTVIRQIAFYRYERQVHQERKEGELTSERLGQIWLDIQRESLGPAIEYNKDYAVFWAYIPHFIHSPFYVYAYAFGDCLVNSLYAVYQDGFPDFEEKYLNMLRAGGTLYHKELLAPFGLDATDPAFWQRGLTMIERLIDSLEEE